MTPFRGTNRVTSIFGTRTDPTTGKPNVPHRGKDSVTDGDWTVREVTGGKVIRVGYDASRGNYIDIRTSPAHFERYQHMASIFLKKGDAAPQGRHVGMAGNTGQSTGPHLHFGVYRCGAETDGYTTLAQINTLEQYAVDPSQWDSLPNKTGTYPGNNDYDGAPTPTPAKGLYTVTVGPASEGDKTVLELFANALNLPVKVEDAQ